MALKGTTKIELTNVKTGEKEVIEKDNLVTNAVGDILSMNPDGYLFQKDWAFSSNMLPVCPNLIGGILLYEKPLEEDAAKYYAPDDNQIIGYSSNDVSTGTDIKRGSMNQTESGVLEDGSGYRFVFDFATSQGNGTISSLGLTSKWGGREGYGSAEKNEDAVIGLSSYYSTDFDISEGYGNAANMKYAYIVSIDSEKDIAYFAYVSGERTISLGKINAGFNQIGLVNTIGPRSGHVLETTSISTEIFNARTINKYELNYAVCDGGDEFIWFFEHADGANGNSSGNASINYVKISKNDWSFIEGSFQVSTQIYPLGYHASGYYENWNFNNKNIAIVKDGFLYCLNYKRNGVVKIELENPANTKIISYPNGGTIDIVSAYLKDDAFGATQFNTLGNVVYFPGGYILDDVIYPVKSTGNTSTSDSYVYTFPRGLKGGCGSKLHYGPFLILYTRHDLNGAERILALMTPYLATINNLPTPVQKTADKTMKITYILREE